jgi:hypothetical protein
MKRTVIHGYATICSGSRSLFATPIERQPPLGSLGLVIIHAASIEDPPVRNDYFD